MGSRAPTHVVLIPSYNTGARLLVATVRAARAAWSPVWVVIDGSTDDSAEAVSRLAEEDSGLTVVRYRDNRGKGAAIAATLPRLAEAGFTHVLTMDADGQHPAGLIPEFMARSVAEPDAVILGAPVFDASAPRVRLRGRRLCNWWVHFETGGEVIGDSLFGFRVYPIAPLRRIMESHRTMRGFDFEPEAAVRLCWSGHPMRNLAAPVRYLSSVEGGVSHFRYGRDNLLLIAMHVRLVAHAVWRRLRGAGARVSPLPRP